MSRQTLIQKVYDKVKAEYKAYIDDILSTETPDELAKSDKVYDYIVRDCMTFCFGQLASGKRSYFDLSTAGLKALLGINNTLEYCCRPGFFAVDGDEIYNEIVAQTNYAAQFVA